MIASCPCCDAPGPGAPAPSLPIGVGYLRTSAEVISGKEERKPASMALHSVDSAGLHMDACKNAMRCSSVAKGGHGRARELHTGGAVWCVGCGVMVAECLGDASTIHRPVASVRVPVRMMAPSRTTIKFAASKCAVQPSSHSVPTEIRAAPGKFGKRCAFLARCGTPGGRRRSHVYVEVAMLPSGSLTEMGVSDW